MFIGGLQAAAFCGTSLAPIIDFDFVNNPAAALARLTVSRASGVTYFDSTGTLQTAANNVGRIDYDPATLTNRGLLVEQAGTNSIRNPRGEGASAGTPGTLPTNWSGATSSNGISRQVVGIGAENGIPYVDIRWFGTATATSNIDVVFEGVGNITTASTQTWTANFFARLVGGTISGINSANLEVAHWTSTPGYNGPTGTIGISITSAALNTQRNASVFIPPASTTSSYHGLQILWSSGAVIDVTIRIGAPQLELGGVATSVILPTAGSPAASSRAGEQSSSGLALSKVSTLLAKSLIGATITNYGGIATIDDNSNNNRYALLYNPTNSFGVYGVVGGSNLFDRETTVAGAVGNALRIGGTSDGAISIVNGTQIYPSSPVAIPPTTLLHVGTSGANNPAGRQWVQRIQLYPRAMSVSELQSRLATL